MLKIEAGQFIEVHATQGYDSMGQPELKLVVEGNFEITNMQNDLITLGARLDSIEFKAQEEDRLRNENPALKDIHDKYQIVYELVKKAETSSGNDGGG